MIRQLFFRRLRFLGALILLSFCACSKSEELKPVRSSSGYSMDGTRYIPISGVQDEIDSVVVGSASSLFSGFSCGPVALVAPYGFAIADRAGKIYLYSNKDSLLRAIDIGATHEIHELVVDSNELIALDAAGSLSSYDLNGKQLWKAQVAHPDELSTSTISGNAIVITTKNAFEAFDIRSGKALWSISTASETGAIAAQAQEHQIACALYSNVIPRSDSILILLDNGTPKAQFGIPKFRITSNIALRDNILIVGGLFFADTNNRSVPTVLEFDLSGSTPKELWRHAVPYLILNIALNTTNVFTAGFRTLDHEDVSGIDAFAIKGSTHVWSRRLSEPVNAPLAVSDGNIYFTLRIQSSAILASKSLFYVLDATNGKTEKEHALRGAMNGFASGMPVPDERGRLLLADWERPVIYTLDRSGLRTIF